MIHPLDVLGLLGAATILITYGLSQARKLSVERPLYPMANAVGAGLILLSLTRDFNLSATVIESAWLGISLYGLWMALRRSAPPRSNSGA